MGNRVHSDPEVGLLQSHQLLASVHNGSLEKAKLSMVYNYNHGFRGFSAQLTKKQAALLAKMPEVISVFPNKLRKLHTTYSWEFLGMPNDISLGMPSDNTRPQEDVIIGFIDTGIWPESPSFSDHEMSPVPSRWKGICQSGEGFPTSKCNRKIIGARYYLGGYESENGRLQKHSRLTGLAQYRSSRDSTGHGSHTASTAAGRYVSHMNYHGLAMGSARGGAPLSRIAVYKACWDTGCYDSDLLAAFDDAVRDGVDILSLSLGADLPESDYFSDAISVGSYHAAQHGITVVCSVGNDGSPSSATNLAPWMITVAASSTDRDFTSDIHLSGRTSPAYSGESLNMEAMRGPADLLSAANAHTSSFTPYQSSFCLNSSLDETKVAGKILVCLYPQGSSESKTEKSQIVKAAGGVGMILIDEFDKNIAIPFSIPSALVDNSAGHQILGYINNTRSPKAYISPAKTVFGESRAPQIASFSSKGPNSLTPDILKPDITAPGLNILAAWSPAKKGENFNIMSGTSMACPHVTGIAAVIKAQHPSWSPSAIKSALTTTATVSDNKNSVITSAPSGRPANPFDFGAGVMRPTKVNDPGLIYDITVDDFKRFLCNYGSNSLRKISVDHSSCRGPPLAASSLNYPSITISDFKGKRSVMRTVTNVGSSNSTFWARISHPRGIAVRVHPKVLRFNSSGEKMSFRVHLKGQPPVAGTYVFGSLSWVNGKQRVRSPLVIGSTSL
eukprot:TRINITY_DN1156_c0_g1_i14.p1 TRINITY_DN1156_c0_g1~~TRINITY_DN1156_c0_g1_i14.p1  ORF type:complete len:729 (+),score=123.35 TRINITY_DN1156_c0_g1_i14:264-2450(+)